MRVVEDRGYVAYIIHRYQIYVSKNNNIQTGT